jgi:hypothetical protein
MARRTSARALAFTAAAAVTMLNPTASAASNPFAGKWVLNVEKSTFDPGPALKSLTMTVTEAGDGALHEVIVYVEGNGSGAVNHLEFTTAVDGKSVPVSGGAEADSVTATYLSPRTIKYVFKKSGKWVETGTFSVSRDGKTMQGPLSGKDTHGTWKYHYVCDRQ